jgi:hypothetical protein
MRGDREGVVWCGSGVGGYRLGSGVRLPRLIREWGAVAAVNGVRVRP